MERVPCSECTEQRAKAMKTANLTPRAAELVDAGAVTPRALFAVRLVLAEVDSTYRVIHAVDQDPMQLCGVHYALLIREMNLSALLEMQVSSLIIEAGPQ